MESIVTPDIVLALREKGITAPEIISVESAAECVGALSVHAGEHYAIVCDARTRAALPVEVPHAIYIELPGVPVPDMATVKHVRRAAAGGRALVALGSGTISDICKYAAFLDGKPYVALPTAPSMNGYLSANASLLVEGHKQSFAARLPVAVVLVRETLAHAPKRLLRAGVGDSLARSTAQADWLLSHYMHGTPYDARPFAWLAPYEAELLAHPENAENLMRILLLSGLGMTVCGGSYPASQGEHMIVHAYEALFGAGDVLHGEAVAVATVYMARLQEKLLTDASLVPPEIAIKIKPVTVPSSTLAKTLATIDAPTAPEHIGWDGAKFAEAARRAPEFRDRFTFLNLDSE